MKTNFLRINKKSAFTLVELIIVIAVITILAGFIIIAINPASIFANARNGQRANDLQNINASIGRYLAETPITGAIRDISDFSGFTTLYQAATGSYFAYCDGGASGINLTSVPNPFDINNTGTYFLDFQILMDKGYLPKIPREPSGNPYKACIDRTTANKLIIYSSEAENNSIVYQASIGTTKTIAAGSFIGGSGADGPLALTSDKNINIDLKSNGRTCADAVNFSVLSLTTNTATLNTDPNASSTCLSVNDEVLLINQLGASGNNTNIGKYETLKIASISSTLITFSSNKTKFYGNGASDDTNLGTAAINQRVMLQRVPNYSSATIDNGVTLTASAWDGTRSGIVYIKSSGNFTNNGSINVNAKGFGDTEGPGAGQRPACGCGCGNTAGGGGYGGQGGYGNGTPGGTSYGSAAIPINLGSGGNNADCGSGGNGGGVIFITSSGTITNFGIVTANGGNGASRAGGGSGGSIYLEANNITGSGSLTSSGGNGGDSNGGCWYCDARYGGSGAGGRVTVKYKATNTSSGTISSNTGVSSGNIGENGTLFLIDSTNNDLYINSSQTWRPNVEGTLSYRNITISNNSTIYLSSYFTNNTDGIGVTLNVTNFTLSAGSFMDMNGRGYGAGAGQGPGQVSGCVCGCGNSAGGGGYGGVGGTGNGPAGGVTYGVATSPTLLGSGGGCNGGSGGGALHIIATGTITVSGNISANGTTGGTQSGGGSGGSIFLEANVITGSGTLTTNGGNGGDWAGNRYGGSGGGGRIALKYHTTNTFTGSGTAISNAGISWSPGGGIGGNGTISIVNG